MKFYYDVKGQNKKFNSTHAGRTRSNVFPFAIASLSLLLLLFANGACRAERTKKDPQQPHDCLVLYAKQQFCQLLFFCFVTISSIGFSLSHFQSHTHGHIAMQNCELYLFAEMPVAYTKKKLYSHFFVAPLCQHILTIGVVVTVFRRRFGMVVTQEIPANLSHVREPKPLNI